MGVPLVLIHLQMRSTVYFYHPYGSTPINGNPQICCQIAFIHFKVTRRIPDQAEVTPPRRYEPRHWQAAMPCEDVSKPIRSVYPAVIKHANVKSPRNVVVFMGISSVTGSFSIIFHYHV